MKINSSLTITRQREQAAAFAVKAKVTALIGYHEDKTVSYTAIRQDGSKVHFIYFDHMIAWLRKEAEWWGK